MPDIGQTQQTGQTQGHGLATLPNAVTFARLCAVPFAVWLVLHHQFHAAFWLFAAAGASDALDGWLARRYGGSFIGALLDPIADKALLVTMFVALAVIGVLPDWLAMLVVFRDLVIVGGVLVLWLLGQMPAIRPLFVSKLNTTLQIVLVAAALLIAGWHGAAPVGPAGDILLALIWIVAVATLVSGAASVWKVARHR